MESTSRRTELQLLGRSGHGMGGTHWVVAQARAAAKFWALRQTLPLQSSPIWGKTFLAESWSLAIKDM